MPVVDYAALPEIPMRAGVTGRWLSSHTQGAAGTSVLVITHDHDIADSLPRQVPMRDGQVV